jgi:acyl-coenzyme A thioesterase PaaI-like protein
MQQFNASCEFDRYYHEEQREFWFRFQPANQVQGPPGNAHGGFIATILDEAMGAGVWLSGHAVLAAKLDVTYRRSVPLGKRHYVRARITREDRRRVYTTADLLGEKGEKHVSARGVFIVFPLDQRGQVPEEFAQYLEFHAMRRDGIGVRQAVEIFARVTKK